MKAGRVEKTTPAQIIEQMRDILEPWASDVDLIDRINERTNLITDLGLDSVGILQVILQTEKQFGISIEEHELDSNLFSAMGNFVSLIRQKIYEANRPA